MNQEAEHGGALNWTTYPPRYPGEFHAHTSATLSPFSDELYFTIEGHQIGGHFEMSQTGERGSGVVVVDIEADYRHADVLDGLQIFYLRLGDTREGVEIFRTGIENPSLNGSNNIRLHIHVRLPIPASGSNDRLRINSLTTCLPLFSHRLHHLAQSVYFRNVALQTNNCPIKADSLAGDVLSFRTANAEVLGTIQVAQSLHVDTSNAPVSLHTSLLDGNETSSTRMVIDTSNGPITADVQLDTISEDPNARGSYTIVARTTNAPLAVNFSEHAVNAQLSATLQTQNAPARVKLHPAFEGRFELHSSPFFPPNISETYCQDPAGMGRTRRVVRQRTGMGAVLCSVGWQPAAPVGRREGLVKVQTSNAPLFLSL